MAYSFTEKKRIRKDFGKQPGILGVPYLLAIQLDSYRRFLQADVADERDAHVYVSRLADRVTVTIRAAATDEVAAERLEHDLRLRAHRRLRELGVWAA